MAAAGGARVRLHRGFGCTEGSGCTSTSLPALGGLLDARRAESANTVCQSGLGRCLPSSFLPIGGYGWHAWAIWQYLLQAALNPVLSLSSLTVCLNRSASSDEQIRAEREQYSMYTAL